MAATTERLQSTVGGGPHPTARAGEEISAARAELAAALARNEELQRALVASRQIGMALGILMERHRLTAETAFDHLRELSQRGNTKLRDVAERIVDTTDAGQPRT